MIRIATVVYPTDFSSYSTQAYFHAVALAERYAAALAVVHVFTPAAGLTRDQARAQLETIQPTNPAIKVTHALLDGDPAGEIVRYAGEVAAGVVVLGTHGRTGSDRPAMGGVAERVVRDASCSVLVVKLAGKRKG